MGKRIAELVLSGDLTKEGVELSGRIWEWKLYVSE